MLKKYAKLIVRQGVNLQPNQDLVIDASIENYELVREIAKEAYALKARDVIVHYVDAEITKLRYQNCSIEHFETVPNYLKELKNQYALKHAAVVSITSTDPDLMQDIDPLKMTTWNKAMHIACKEFYDHLELGIDRWCIVGAPSVGWANKVYPDMSDQEAVDALWRAIFHATRCDEEDPIEAWEKHRHSFESRVKKLNDYGIRHIHLSNSLGTNLTLALPDDYLFAGGGSYTTDGIYSFPNMPTEEIFVSPHREGVNGIVYSSMPLNYNGHIVDEFSITFENGRVIDFQAKKGYDVLKSIIETDEGSQYLGEVALVPYNSPIREMNTLFYNTLFDENAACHLALGRGFGECLKNGLEMSREELLANGVNDSMTHVDFMFGTSDLRITALVYNGEEVEIFKDGNFTFD